MDVLQWGSTEAERASHFACDDAAFVHDQALFRAITIAAPPALVYRWLTQIRVAPYSYDFIDNFGRTSPPRLTPGIDVLAVGQRAMIIFKIAAFEPGRSLSLELDSRAYAVLFGALLGTYRVDEIPGGSRLISKILVRYPPNAYGRALRAVLPFLDLVMFRKQLLTLKRYAERDAAAARYRPAAHRVA